MTLKASMGGVLFIKGNEVRTATGDRLLLIPGDEHADSDSQRSTQEVLSRRSSSFDVGLLIGRVQELGSDGLQRHRGLQPLHERAPDQSLLCFSTRFGPTAVIPICYSLTSTTGLLRI